MNERRSPAERNGEFEKLRQSQETRNEIIINYVQLAHFGSVFAANSLTYFLPVAPYRASMSLMALITGQNSNLKRNS